MLDHERGWGSRVQREEKVSDDHHDESVKQGTEEGD